MTIITSLAGVPFSEAKNATKDLLVFEGRLASVRDFTGLDEFVKHIVMRLL